MKNKESRQRVGRVIYQKLHCNESIEVTADFFSDDSYVFVSQDQWEVRAYPYEPDESELAYAKLLLERNLGIARPTGHTDRQSRQDSQCRFVTASRLFRKTMVKVTSLAGCVLFRAPVNT